MLYIATIMYSVVICFSIITNSCNFYCIQCVSLINFCFKNQRFGSWSRYMEKNTLSLEDFHCYHCVCVTIWCVGNTGRHNILIHVHVHVLAGCSWNDRTIQRQHYQPYTQVLFMDAHTTAYRHLQTYLWDLSTATERDNIEKWKDPEKWNEMKGSINGWHFWLGNIIRKGWEQWEQAVNI